MQKKVLKLLLDELKPRNNFLFVVLLRSDHLDVLSFEIKYKYVGPTYLYLHYICIVVFEKKICMYQK